MVYLSPSTIYLLEHATGTYGKLYFILRKSEIATLPSNHIEHYIRFVDRVIVILHIDLRLTVEYSIIDELYFVPPSLDSAQGVVHSYFVRLSPVVCHRFNVAMVECVIELNKCLVGRRQIPLIFIPSYRCLNRFHICSSLLANIYETDSNTDNWE